MIKAINQWCFPGVFGIKECVEAAAEFGFEGFEPAFGEDGPVSLASSKADLEAIVRLAADSKIKLTSLASGLYWKYSPSSTDAAARKKACDIIRAQIETAAALGVDAILVVPGAVNEETPYDEAFKLALDSIAGAVGCAEKNGVVIGIENVWNKFLLSPLEMRDFVKSFGSRYVRAYFDAGNVLSTGYPEHWIKILGGLICKVHIKDYRTGVGTLNGFVDLLSGDVNFPRVMEALKAVGYDDAIIAEVSPAAHFPAEAARRTSHAMDAILGR